MPRLPPSAQLDWSDEGAPRAARFDDVYFSRAGGLAEAQAVFLDGCNLPQAWCGKDHFAIGELGFGTGLNVLATWNAWKKTRCAHAILHIFSVEAFPLARADAARALAHFPELESLAALLLARWPVRAAAPQRLWFPDDGFALTLLTGEVEACLAGVVGHFDAWFLDGFAPSRNSAMWTEAVFGQIARLSRPDARLASFTVAGHVRRGLEAVGFAVQKKQGFGAKRERLEARFQMQFSADGTASPVRVAVLGAGIAGAATAAALVRRGIEAIVLDSASETGAGASGNPAGLVMPRLDRGGGATSELFLAAYLDAVATYEAQGDCVFARCGVEEGATGALVDLLADPPLPEEWFSGLANGSALHGRAGLVRPRAAIEQFLRGAQLMCETAVAALERAGEGWLLRAPDGRALLKADAVVLACGAALTQFAPARFLPIALSRGQIEWGPGPAPARALTCGSYLAPFDGGVLFGATFDAAGPGLEVDADAASRSRNVAALARLAPEIAAGLDAATLRSRAALRATTPDRVPIAGRLPNVEAWLDQLKQDKPEPIPMHKGVYVLGGLGARGLTLAPLLGEVIASEMCAEPQALSRRALDAIDPARFLHRALKRGLTDRLG